MLPSSVVATIVASCSHLCAWLSGDGQEELELGWQLVLRVQSVGEVDSTDTAVGVDLHSTQTFQKLVSDLNFEPRLFHSWKLQFWAAKKLPDLKN